MGVGGLLMEIVTRPQPREEPVADSRRVAAVVLAAGRSTRMAGTNKLTAKIEGKALVRIAVEQALASRATPVIVVTGHEREAVEAALDGLPVRLVHNPDFAQGLGTSLRTGIAAVPADADAAVVCLGDMPQVDATLIDRLLAAFDPDRGALAVVPTIDGQRGNPVLWARRFFPDLMGIEGDIGARQLIGRYAEAVAEVPVTGRAGCWIWTRRKRWLSSRPRSNAPSIFGSRRRHAAHSHEQEEGSYCPLKKNPGLKPGVCAQSLKSSIVFSACRT